MKLRNIILATAALFAIGPVASLADDGTRLVALSGYFTAFTAPVYGTVNMVLQEVSATNKRSGLAVGTGYVMGQSAQANTTKDFFLFNFSTSKYTAYAGQNTDVLNLQGASIGFTPFSNLPTSATGELALAKIAASGTAPGAGALKLAAVAGTTAGTCKIIAYAGTSTTPVTIYDNIGAGC